MNGDTPALRDLPCGKAEFVEVEHAAFRFGALGSSLGGLAGWSCGHQRIRAPAT